LSLRELTVAARERKFAEQQLSAGETVNAQGSERSAAGNPKPIIFQKKIFSFWMCRVYTDFIGIQEKRSGNLRTPFFKKFGFTNRLSITALRKIVYGF
jgi:hypothetical protein